LENKGIFHIFKSIIKVKVFKVGDDIDTDQIYPGRYLCLTSPEEIFLHAIEGVIPDFANFNYFKKRKINLLFKKIWKILSF
jgi:3-isopropylmalate dehydratase small subunit